RGINAPKEISDEISRPVNLPGGKFVCGLYRAADAALGFAMDFSGEKSLLCSWGLCLAAGAGLFCVFFLMVSDVCCGGGLLLRLTARQFFVFSLPGFSGVFSVLF
ncbi:hypothetical protein, partial [Streptomyces sp. NPDC058385]|uniref:hypothetical protein n=1 Tax=Streptomyces sp. NPDC058385 TaxID=3346473 RepID=UPI00365F49EF